MTRSAVALLVGVGTYRRADRIAPLRYAPRDARALARLLADPDVCAFPRHNVALLTDARASHKDVRRRLSRWLPERAVGADLAFVYFAGHGVVERIAGRDEGYLLPHDADPDDVVGQGIAMSDVARWIDRLQARAVVVCLDCCHAGTILPNEGLSLRGDRDMQIQPSLFAQLSGKGRFLLASCDRGQKSIEAEELKHGLFTYHLLRGLEGAGDRDGDGQVSVAELFGYVAAAVSRDARERFGREQTPWTSAVYTEEVFLSRARGSKAPSTHAEEPATSAEDAPLLEELRGLSRSREPAGLTVIFRSLAHKSDPVRRRAHQALQALGWDEACRLACAQAAQADTIAAVLDGLAALEASERVVGLLDRLVGVLRGASLDRARWLRDRKALALQLPRLAAAFKERNIGIDLVRVLGPGLYTGAYLGRTKTTGLDVVLRILRPEFALRPQVRATFLELGKRSARLVHQNLVLTRDAGEHDEDGLYYTVRDYVSGATLREVLESGRPLGPLQACKVLRQVLEGLTPLHREGMPHAGVKPSNIFLTDDQRVMLGDPSLPLPGMGEDTARLAYDYRYAPPELFQPSGPGPASDLYSLGCVAHELFAGAPPFVSESPYELIARLSRDAVEVPAILPPGVAAWLTRLLARDPGERFPTLSAALEALADVERNLRRPRAEPTTTLPPPPPAAPAPRPVTAADLASVELLPPESLAAAAGVHSILPLTNAGGPPVSDAGQTMDESAAGWAERVRPEAISPPGYEVLETIGRGGMGVVYKAMQKSLNRVVAIKMILAGLHAGDEQRARFRTEAEVVARLQHPHIMQIYELGELDGIAFIVMEYCGGHSLSHRLHGQVMSPADAARLLVELSGAVQHAHERGIVHRDLKPANVLFTEDGQAKVTDFGLARRMGEERHTITGAVLGTPSYMAPEQARGETAVGPAVDVWALGAILYECLTGRPPFREATAFDTLTQVVTEEAVPPRSLNPAVPPDLETICLKCLEKDPDRRYASATHLAADLERFLTQEPVMARRRGRERWWWPF